jgi:polyvinyl alcohol dehydrogenase (cytochrome)
MGRLVAVVAVAVVLAGLVPVRGTAQPASTPIGPMDWRTYGHDLHHTFVGSSTINAGNASTLARAWFFQTGDAVTANPIAVGDTVYVGSWDGNFYALNRATGALRWKFAIKPQPAVSPQPGSFPRDVTSDGGLITSSAWYEPANALHPDLVLFGGGYTMYALDAHTGHVYWQHDYTGLPEKPADPANDDTRIFSTPVVVGSLVLFGVTSDGSRGRRGYVVGADLATGKQAWRFETDVDPKTGALRNDGCGGVWASPTVVDRLGLVVLDVADCHFADHLPYDETVFALHIADGSLAWVFRPPRADNGCDFDFGATVNAGFAPDGTATFLGVGGKDGTYYSLDPATGKLRWQRNVVFGGFAGGFIATAAYDGKRVYGATALGDFGRFEGVGSAGCQLGNPRDLPIQEPSMHAIDAATGAVAWEGVASQSFGATTVTNGLTFVGTGIARSIQVRDAGTGTPVIVIPLTAPSDSGVAASGNAIFFGTGSSEQGVLGVGVNAYTPGGVPPSAPMPSQPVTGESPPPSGVAAGRATAPSSAGRAGLPPTGGLPWATVGGGGLALALFAVLRRLRQLVGVERLHGDVEG